MKPQIYYFQSADGVIHELYTSSSDNFLDGKIINRFEAVAVYNAHKALLVKPTLEMS